MLQELDKGAPNTLFIYVTQRSFGGAGTSFQPAPGDLQQESAACVINRDPGGGWVFVSRAGTQAASDPQSAAALFEQFVQNPANAYITLVSRAQNGYETVLGQSTIRGGGGASSGSLGSLGALGSGPAAVFASWAVLVVAIILAIYFYRNK